MKINTIKNIALLTGFILTVVFNAKTQTIAEDETFTGKVKTVNIVTTPLNEPEESRRVWKHTIEFTEAGKKTFSSASCEAIDVKTESTFSYDQEWNLSTIESTHGKITYEYKNEKLQEMIEYNSEDSVIKKFDYSYNAKGLVESENEYEHSNKLKYKTVFSYNDKKLCIEKKWMYPDMPKAIKTETFSYDNRGNRTKYKFDWADEENSEMHDFATETTYDENNRWTRVKEIDKNGKVSGQSAVTYDAKGNTLTHTSYNAKGKAYENTTYVYEYDTKGNWVKQKRSVNGKLQGTIERSIVYY
jgi:hypothetical protein